MYESPSSKLSWQLSGNLLRCTNVPGDISGGEYSVKVLTEELAYNKMLKQFKMFIIEKPLDPSYKVRRESCSSVLREIWFRRLLSSTMGRRVEKTPSSRTCSRESERIRSTESSCNHFRTTVR